MIAPRGVRIGRHGPMVNSVARRVARNGVETAPDYEEPIDDDPIEPPAGEPEPPTDTPPDADNDNEPEPGFDADYVAPARIEIVDDKQTVVRTSTAPGTWGNAYVASALTGPEYWEVEVAASTPNNATLAVGVSTLAMPLNGVPGELAGTIAYWSDGRVRQNGATLMTLATYGRRDRIGVSYDADGGVRLFKNCTPLNGGDAVGTLTTAPRYPFVGLYSTNSRTAFRFSLSKFGCTLPDDFFPIGQVPAPAGPDYSNPKYHIALTFTGADGSTTITDESSNERVTNSVSGATIENNQLLLDGTGQVYWLDPAGDIQDNAGDLFAIEFDVIFASLATPGATQYIASKFSTASNDRSWAVVVTTAATVQFLYSTNGFSGGTSQINVAPLSAFSTSEPRRIKVEKNADGNIATYLDGVLQNQAAFSGKLYDSPVRLGLGANANTAARWAGGRLDNFVIIKGATS